MLSEGQKMGGNYLYSNKDSLDSSSAVASYAVITKLTFSTKTVLFYCLHNFLLRTNYSNCCHYYWKYLDILQHFQVSQDKLDYYYARATRLAHCSIL